MVPTMMVLDSMMPKDFHNINSWDNYREYMKSNLAAEIKRPSKELFAYREFNRIATDRD